jgi:folate-binding protein YgfZ
LVAEKSFLLEANAEALNGVDFSKGCFVGQEVTARMKHRTQLKKRLLPVRLEGGAPDEPTPIVVDGREVGELRSHRGNRGIALIRSDGWPDDASRERPDAALAAGDARVTPIWPDWLPRPS